MIDFLVDSLASYEAILFPGGGEERRLFSIMARPVAGTVLIVYRTISGGVIGLGDLLALLAWGWVTFWGIGK